MNEEKTLFTAVLEKSGEKGYYFEDVRTRSGDVIKKYLIPKLTLDDRENIEKSESGQFIVFLATVYFENIKMILS
jgi:hypothetical protein